MEQAPRRPFLTEIHFRVQTYDIDFAGIVSNIVYIRWLEDLRLKMLDEQWPLDQQMAAGYLPVLLSTEITYRKALRLFERPLGRMWLADMGRARWTLEAEILRDDGPAATVVQTCAFVSADTLKPLPIPLALRKKYESA
jgi:acyl-CoA thioester hydrolase